MKKEKSTFEITQEFFDLWQKTYETTYGKVFNIPSVGPLREEQEKITKNISTSVNLCTSMMDSNTNFMNVFLEAMRRIYEKTIDQIKDGITPEYENFYDIWIETYSETFKEFLKTDHFATDSGKLMSNLMDFQQNNKEIIEDNILKPLNIATRTDVSEINKEIYLLKKQVKELTSKIIELSKE